MTKQDKASNKLMIYRLITLFIIAYLLIRFDIVDDSTPGSDVALYIFAVIIALPITMLLDKYIVRFAKTGSLK